MAARPAQEGSADGQAEGAVPARLNRKAALILAAARQLFLDHGFDSITMEMVARQAAVSKATLYAHFSSKEELFTAVTVAEANRVTDEVWQIVPDSNDVAAVLRRVAEKFVDIFLSEQTMFLQRAVIGVVPRFPAIGERIFDSGPKVLNERLARFLAGAHDRGLLNVPNATLAAVQFLSVVRGDLEIRGLLLPAAPPSRAEIEDQIEAGIDLFLTFYSRPET
jgi:TetR/AcrR family transcriptional regulator, mexJK operon transcriptional repressor